MSAGRSPLLQNGDLISVDVRARRIELKISDEEMAERKASWQPPVEKYPRSYTKMYIEHVTQANDGCDFDFLEYTGDAVPEPEIH